MENLTTNKRLSFNRTFSEALEIGLKNSVSISLCAILLILTFWIPYINIGVMIAVLSLPVQLAKGEIINPMSVFDSKYRRYIGEVLIAYGLIASATLFSILFMIIPAIVISVAWSLWLYILIDKNKNPIQAIKASNDATYGSKWTIFLVRLCMGICFMVVNLVVSIIFADYFIGLIILLLLVILEISISISLNASIWRQLKDNVE